MGVSKNNGIPKSSLRGFSIRGIPIFGNTQCHIVRKKVCINSFMSPPLERKAEEAVNQEDDQKVNPYQIGLRAVYQAHIKEASKKLREENPSWTGKMVLEQARILS